VLRGDRPRAHRRFVRAARRVERSSWRAARRRRWGRPPRPGSRGGAPASGVRTGLGRGGERPRRRPGRPRGGCGRGRSAGRPGTRPPSVAAPTRITSSWPTNSRRTSRRRGTRALTCRPCGSRPHARCGRSGVRRWCPRACGAGSRCGPRPRGRHGTPMNPRSGPRRAARRPPPRRRGRPRTRWCGVPAAHGALEAVQQVAVVEQRLTAAVAAHLRERLAIRRGCP
jgi:hypothetical protein